MGAICEGILQCRYTQCIHYTAVYPRKFCDSHSYSDSGGSVAFCLLDFISICSSCLLHISTEFGYTARRQCSLAPVYSQTLLFIYPPKFWLHSISVCVCIYIYIYICGADSLICEARDFLICPCIYTYVYTYCNTLQHTALRQHTYHCSLSPIYGVATMSRRLKMIGLFRRISSLL